MIAGFAASLHLQSGTTTTNYRSALHKAASMDTIQCYIQNKNKWTDAEFASINWVAHGCSVCRFYHKKQFIVKFVHEWLPLGRLTSKYKHHHLLTCPTCSHAIEDGDHFLRCTEHLQWQSDMFRALCRYFDKPLQGHFSATCCSPVYPSGSTMNQPSFSTFPPSTTV